VLAVLLVVVNVVVIVTQDGTKVYLDVAIIYQLVVVLAFALFVKSAN